MACGVPVVTTDFAGAAEAVLAGPEDAAGEVVRCTARARDLPVRALDAVRDVLEDQALRDRRAAAARRRAERVFSPTAVLDRLDTAYDLAVQDRRTRRAAAPGAR
jgi:glycosyltransferase involved in cell wall biosynthesis